MIKNKKKRTSFKSIFTDDFLVSTKRASQIAFLLVSTFVLLFISFRPAVAETHYPLKGKPITIIVPSRPGGTLDITARLVGPIIEKELKTSVVVENKPGGHLMVGLTALALSKPDGHTIGVIPLPMGVIVYLDPETKAIPQVRELQPIATHNVDVVAVVVNAESPYRKIKDLVDAAKANPNALLAGTDGVMGFDHMMSLVFMKETGTKFKLVHFQGGSRVTTALAGNHVNVRIGKVGSVYSMMKGGKVRIIGVFDKKRSKYCPEAETIEEAGYKGMSSGYHYNAFIAPKGTPRKIVDVLSNVVKVAVASDEAKKRLDGVALNGSYMGTDELSVFWKDSERIMGELMIEAKKSIK